MDKRPLFLGLLLVVLLGKVEDAHGQRSGRDGDAVSLRSRRLFARRKVSPPAGSQPPKLAMEVVTPSRRCSRVAEGCSPHLPCCDPCAACRCRLFNTICYCLRLSPHCPRRP